jgi:hypothetical protein
MSKFSNIMSPAASSSGGGGLLSAFSKKSPPKVTGATLSTTSKGISLPNEGGY